MSSYSALVSFIVPFSLTHDMLKTNHSKHNDLTELIPVETIVDDYPQLKSCRALPCPDFSEDVFSAEEKDVLYTVMRKFRSNTGQEISNYMHEEVAYTRTKDREIIPYSLAKKDRPF